MKEQFTRFIGGGIRDRQEYPLMISFEAHMPNGLVVPRKAGFRGWEHYLAYVRQMKERNNIDIRHPIELKETLQ